MAASATAEQRETRALERWMAAVGVFYVLLGLRLLPWINGPMIDRFRDQISPGAIPAAGTAAFALLIDWMATFGLDLLVLGAVLIVAAGRAFEHRVLVYVVIGQELVRGVLADLWFAARPFNSAAFYVGFMIVHAVIIVAGLWALRRARTATAGLSAAPS